ncbi:LytTR family DNA-binding domain-containing protein [Marinifilum flexuosum]|uniref:LytTR family transcriptional regulator n=1 Tax=Marinifilum flexuosum TaxID=1117708 RepID=A0A419X330_9BACT|nr:LytTR family DNA-binding domain-containing protein [Marinifilum flexuosum]RKE02020.1 LytTR family transcriptional regulator [Marinifilum flexuosum]
MNFSSFNWLNQKYSQNYIIRKPLIGTLIVAVFCYLFTILYRPQNTNSSDPFSYEVTIAIYLLALMPPLYFMIKVLKLLPNFKSKENWTLLKEVEFGVILFLILGVWNYFVGFIMENPEGRWNIYTFLDSVKSTLTVGILPYSIISIQNSRFLFASNSQQVVVDLNAHANENEVIHINSKLKKGDISFDPESFLYAESNGNYVIFHFLKNDMIQKEMLRNSIGDVEKQLSEIPYLMRIHRAFIVNVNKVSQKKGNSSGYRLSIDGLDVDLPVSRQNVANYDQVELNLKKSQVAIHPN